MSDVQDWTSHVPTTPGFYWIMDGPDDEPVIVKLRDDRQIVSLSGPLLNDVAGRIYYGPLAPPD